MGPIQTRIVERLPDGNYRIKGQQPFMIGKREYKVIIVGLLRPEDYNDEGINSSKIIDPQYDVVSIRKKETTK
jgi:flagellar L-ring protein precursor FlgH